MQGNVNKIDISFPNFIDSIALKMSEEWLVDLFDNSIVDKSYSNKYIILIFVISKMKIKTSLSDITFAITDINTLSHYNEFLENLVMASSFD